MTEDGQTGQIIISSDGSYPRELDTPNGTISLEDMSIPTSEANVLSIEEDSMEQISGIMLLNISNIHWSFFLTRKVNFR